LARPTRRMYLGVLAAFIVFGAGGGWLAVSWPGLAAAYYVRQARDPRADPATVRRALERVARYDRRRYVAFWERELTELNRLEAARRELPADRLYATFEVERCVVKEGEDVHISAVIHNPTERELELPNWRIVVWHPYPLAEWAAARRAPERWTEVEGLLYGMERKRDGSWSLPVRGLARGSRFLPARGRARERVWSGPAETNVHVQKGASGVWLEARMSGLFRAHVFLDSGLPPGTPTPKGPVLEGWLTILVLPKSGPQDLLWDDSQVEPDDFTH